MASVSLLPSALRVASGVRAPLPSIPQTSQTSQTRAVALKCRSQAQQQQPEPSRSSPAADVAKWLGTSAVALSAVASIMCGAVDPALAADAGFKLYYGTAASASSYGGYGGNTNKEATAEYTYEVPDEWKERAISKVEKGTNGTDSEFFNPKNRKAKTYSLFLAGFRRLPPKDNVLNDIALSDVDLQDLILSADEVKQTERRDPSTDQLYYDYEIDSPLGHALVSVTCAKNKLYAHFVNVPDSLWSKDEATYRHIHESFKTVGANPLAPVLF
eukprot:TRINITY_DN8160_c0_g1_i1.p1 TRINITY_DN8160_c0_g1~~TRINITY_DN8160_c0_g1_i1.p1  ORF type:complete len:272 (+),score=15.48 TRINITY_DN8160_c0_g1_i1:127-942(+)